MDLKDMRKMQGERTEEELLEKIDKILDDARDGHYSLTWKIFVKRGSASSTSARF